MLDNLTIDNAGHILLQEDPGNQSYVAKMYSYNTTTDVLTTVGQHDETRFVTGGANFLTQDEESSGIIDVQEILGAGQFLLYDQAHYAIAGEVVQGGQLLSFFNPATADSATVITQQPSNSYTKCENEVIEISIAAQHATKYQWQVESNGVFTNLTNDATYADVETSKLSITSSNSLNGSRYRCLASRNTGIIETSNATVVTVNPLPTATITGNSSFCEGSSVLLTSSDASTYEWKEGSTALSTTTKSFSTSEAGSYTVKVTDVNGCSSVSSPKVVSIDTKVIPTFTIKDLVCKGSIAISLPTSSTNTLAITGVWSTGTQSANVTLVNTDVEGLFEFTFTPSSNFCATTYSKSITVSKCASLEENITAPFKIYPNPSNDVISISFSELTSRNGTIKFISADGKLIESREYTNSSLETFDVKSLNPGIYFLQINDSIEKVIVQ